MEKDLDELMSEHGDLEGVLDEVMGDDWQPPLIGHLDALDGLCELRRKQRSDTENTCTRCGGDGRNLDQHDAWQRCFECGGSGKEPSDD